MKGRLPTFGRLPCLLLLLLGLSACGKRQTLVQEGDHAQVLHRSVGHELADLDPQLATQASDYHVLSALFEGLVAEDPIDLHPVPGVAESWDVSADGLDYTFHLRGSARWSDGSPLTAEDFVASYRRLLSKNLAAENAAQLDLLRGGRACRLSGTGFDQVGIKALDTHTLRLSLAAPSPWFLGMLSQPAWYPVPLHVIKAAGPVESRGNRWTRPTTFVGNGPFVLKEWSVNHRIVVARSAQYWDASSVRLSAIHFYPFEIDTEERAFRAGQLHLTDAIPTSKIDYYRAKAPSLLHLDPLLGTYFYRLNTRLAPLNDKRVRQALALALDRARICETVLRGAQLPSSRFVPPGLPGYPAPAGLDFNPAHARALLAEAGFPEGRGFPVLELLYNSSETHRQVAEALQDCWHRELGVEVKLLNMENSSVLAARRSGDFQILRSSWTGDFQDASNFLEIWRKGADNNFTGWEDAGFDSLLDQAAGGPPQETRLKILARAEERLLDGAPCVPLYTYTHVYLMQPSVRGWFPTLLDHHPYKHVWLEP